MEEQRRSDSTDAAVSAIKSDIQGVHHLLKEIDRRYEQRFTEMDARNLQRFNFADRAVEVAETNSQRWRESANEWRDSMNDREIKFVSRETYETAIGGLSLDISDIKERIGKTEGVNIGVDKTWVTIIAIISAAVSAGLVIGIKGMQ